MKDIQMMQCFYFGFSLLGSYAVKAVSSAYAAYFKVKRGKAGMLS